LGGGVEGATAKMAEALRDNPGKWRAGGRAGPMEMCRGPDGENGGGAARQSWEAGGRGREAGAVYTPLLIVSRDIYDARRKEYGFQREMKGRKKDNLRILQDTWYWSGKTAGNSYYWSERPCGRII
jgi:hypothetical protein